MTRFRALASALTLLAFVLVGSAGAAVAADTPTPAPATTGLTATVTPGIGPPGTRVLAQGSGWPARVTIQASTCGNNALRGAADCNGVGAGSTVTNDDGTFELDMAIGKPPKPCPCVVHFVSPDTPQKIDQPFSVTGQSTAPVTNVTTTRSATATARLTGSGPLSAWFGGAAKRTYVLTVTNTGTTVLDNPGLTLTVGKGADPTDVLAQPRLGFINPGQSVVYRLPVTLKAPAFGQYRVKAYFSDLDQPFSVTASTSTYPWILIILGWLLLQPLLLGLYKRRPVLEDGEEEDPFAPRPPAAPAPVGAYGLDHDPLADVYVPVGVGAGVAGAALAGAYPSPAGASTAIVPRQPSQLVPNYRPVFGVSDLRAYLDPAGDLAPVTVAPRIVLGGILPRATPTGQNGQAPYNGQ